MYKLILCVRYLWKRLMAQFAIAGVTLCVAMMLIVTSVMNGFLDKVETAAKGLFGEPTYAECGYVHDCRALAFNSNGTLTWRGELGRDHTG